MATLKEIFNPVTRTLPNGGGSYSVMGGAPVTAASLFPAAPVSVPTAPTITPAPVAPPTPAPAPAPRVFSSPAPAAPAALVETPSPLNVPQGYINPATGELYSAKEIVANMAKKIPLTNAGDMGKYAGDALTAPDQTVTDLESTARGLNNARNDIATGTTDPFKIGKDSGINYSPAQLATIEKAYAGIYDPAINDVFARIKDKQALDAKLASAQSDKDKLAAQKEMAVFNTNENIRQYEATTGKNGGGGKTFTNTQLNNGASNAGTGIADFDQLDDDVKNFYVNPPMVLDENTNKNVPKYKVFEDLLAEVKAGTKTPDEVIQTIKDSTSLPASVKQYFISKMPIAPAQKASHWYDIFLGQ